MNTATIGLDSDVVLEQEGTPAVVVMSFARYRALMEKLEDLEDSLAVLESRLELASDEDEIIPWEQAKAERRATAG
jgi:PHD/YefM family antitoxin component YafN of YafNO toxin-antitoxin module